ncbi:MAG: hypothetical protein K2K80_03630 [Clostridia bacterium]|nr:hypothetical protein [Clostridia bacterium]
MKKIVSVLLTLVSVICIAFACVGCNNVQPEEDVVKGRITGLRYAYREMGWLDENDLKSVACRQYDCYEMQENPYAGLFKQETQISAKEERDFKKVYCDYYNFNNRGTPAELLEPSDIEITNYYGTYDGNVVVEVRHFKEESVIAEDKTHIGGIEFLWDYQRDIYVLHYIDDLSAPVTVGGRLYDMGKAYEEGLLDENDLKSIACFCYDRYGEENPYSGTYVQPAEKLSKENRLELKQAYRNQIDKSPNADLEYVDIYKYFGTYNGYIVVGMDSDSCKFGTVLITEVGGVTNVGWNSIYVYYQYK